MKLEQIQLWSDVMFPGGCGAELALAVFQNMSGTSHENTIVEVFWINR